jgi:CPA2 family monovalent cation:H+ antiporter-2
MEIPILKDIVVILALSLVVSLLFSRVKLPSILGFLITGMLFGPFGLGIIHHSHEIEIMAEIGVILLLFLIGIEFSLKTLAQMRSTVLLGGGLQVGLTIGAIYFISLALNLSPAESLFMGFLIALSSTAIVLSILQRNGTINTPHGKIALGILIFQDVIVVPMMLLAPILGGAEGDLLESLAWMAFKAVGVVVLVLLSARYLVPRVLSAAVATRNRELFIITVVVICFAVTYLTSSVGLSLALGAFMAGLTISESEYSHQATGFIIPFREIFTSFFFVSIGMLLDLSFVISNLPLVLLFTIGVFVLKFVIIFIATWILRFPVRTRLLAAFSLFQVGEFAFILAAQGRLYDVIPDEPYQYFLSVSILTMAATPFALMGAERWTQKLLTKRQLRLESERSSLPQAEKEHELKDHLIIIGFGLNGQNMARIARKAGIQYTILELNDQNVKKAKEEGEPIHYGDATNPYILEHLKIWQARVAVVAISDPQATAKVVSTIRGICNTVHILVRGDYEADTESYLRLGASEVVSTEFETSVELFTRVLHQYLVPEENIGEYVKQMRADNYEALRPFFNANQIMGLPKWQDLKVMSMRVEKRVEGIVDIPLSQAQLRNRLGVSVMAIYRQGELFKVIDPDAHLELNDLIYVFGTPESIAKFGKLIHA